MLKHKHCLRVLKSPYIQRYFRKKFVKNVLLKYPSKLMSIVKIYSAKRIHSDSKWKEIEMRYSVFERNA